MAKRIDRTDQPAGLTIEDMVEIAEWVRKRVDGPAALAVDAERTKALIDAMFAGEDLDDDETGLGYVSSAVCH